MGGLAVLFGPKKKSVAKEIITPAPLEEAWEKTQHKCERVRFYVNGVFWQFRWVSQRCTDYPVIVFQRLRAIPLGGMHSSEEEPANYKRVIFHNRC
ncbi:MAG: hypothetical protein ACYS21_09465, partial [Planctomycetota bacterium]